MKKYELPLLEIITVATEDIITTSPGTESPILPDEEFSW